MFGELNPNEIKVGQQIQVECKYYFCIHATVIEDQCGENKELMHSPKWVGWKIKVDESFGGMSPVKVGDVFSVGWDTEHSHYSDLRIKPVGSMPDYTGFTGEKEFKFGDKHEQ